MAASPPHLTELTGRPTDNGIVAFELSGVAPPYAMQSEANLSDSGATVYSVAGLPGDAVVDEDSRHRFYFGPDPGKDFYDEPRQYLRSTTGAGRAESAAASEMSRILEGPANVPALLTSLNQITRELTPPTP